MWIEKQWWREETQLTVHDDEPKEVIPLQFCVGFCDGLKTMILQTVGHCMIIDHHRNTPRPDIPRGMKTAPASLILGLSTINQSAHSSHYSVGQDKWQYMDMIHEIIVSNNVPNGSRPTFSITVFLQCDPQLFGQQLVHGPVYSLPEILRGTQCQACSGTWYNWCSASASGRMEACIISTNVSFQTTTWDIPRARVVQW